MARVAIQDSDGDAISAANPLPVTLPAGAITIGGDLDVRPLTAADVVTAAQGAADYKVTLDGEIVATTGAPGVVGPFVIANGDATGLSTAVEIGATSLEGLFIPAAFTGTVLTFQAALTLGGTYQNLYDDSGTEVSVAVAAGRAVSIDFAALKLAQWRFLKIRSGTAAAPTTEGGERSIHVVTK